ncbi:MAG: nucleotide exchange factor GrpE [Pseudomonadota bacterium]
MSDEKTTKIEPEVTMPGEGPGDGDPTAQEIAAAASDLSVEDLVPGLGDAISVEEEIEARIAAATAELAAERDALKDRMMRALAEAENVRRRAERDQKDAQTYGGTRLARDLLAVYDNLSRAVSAADDDLRANHAGFLEGVELTQRELINTFSKHKISSVTPELGEKFDANRHQAMFEAPIPGAETGSIIEVIQPGFVIADRLLRPAIVGLAKAVPVAAPAEDAPADEELEPEDDAAKG